MIGAGDDSVTGAGEGSVLGVERELHDSSELSSLIVVAGESGGEMHQS